MGPKKSNGKAPECPVCDSINIEPLGEMPPGVNPIDTTVDAYGCVECRTLFYEN